MYEALNHVCNEDPKLEKLFLAPLQMCGVLKLKKGWHRACVEEIKEGGK